MNLSGISDIYMNLSRGIRDVVAFEKLWDLYSNNILGLVDRVVSQIKSGEIKVGDTVFWRPNRDYVTIVELPSLPASKSHSPSVCGSHVIVRLSSGGTREDIISTLWKWWRGDEKDKVLIKQISKKLTEEDKSSIIEKFNLYFKSREWFETLKIIEVTDNGVLRIRLKDEFANCDETRKMSHFTIEHIMRLHVPIFSAVVVEFIDKKGSSHIVGQ